MIDIPRRAGSSPLCLSYLLQSNCVYFVDFPEVGFVFCFSLATPGRDLVGSCSFNEAETQNLSASRQQNQAVCVGKGKRGRGAKSRPGYDLSSPYMRGSDERFKI